MSTNKPNSPKKLNILNSRPANIQNSRRSASSNSLHALMVWFNILQSVNNNSYNQKSRPNSPKPKRTLTESNSSNAKRTRA